MSSYSSTIAIACLSFSMIACSASSRASATADSADPVEARPAPEPLQDGVVTLPEPSLRFVEIESVGAEQSFAGLRAPAHVAFADGAVSRLGAPLPGRVARVHVQLGDRVAAGAPLVTLDCPEAASSRAALRTSEAAVTEARAALERQVQMLERGVGTERERLHAQRALAEAEAERARARAAVQFVGNQAGTTVVLKAPIAGTVVNRRATVGASVDPAGEPLVEVGDPSALWVIAEVFERDLPLVREGATATLELPATGEQLSGRVAAVGVVVDGGARTAQVRIALDGPTETLRPGTFGRARIASPETALSLPTAAVLIKNGRESVVYVEGPPGTFTRRPVVVGRPIDGRVLVTSGIAPGDRVVVRGALLVDGTAEQLL